MKRIFSFVIVLLMIIFLFGCGKTREELLFDNVDLLKKMSVTFDVTGNGEEEINFIITDDCYLKVFANESEITLGSGGLYTLYKIYGLDLDKNDNYKEIAVITSEESDDNFIRILRWTENGAYPLMFNYDGYVTDAAYIGYDINLSMDEKNKINTSERGHFGMWSVDASYTLSGEEFIKEEKEVRDIIRSSYAYYEENDLTDEEIDDLIAYGMIKDKEEVKLLKDGWALAYTDFNGEDRKCPHGDNVSLLKGDIFKVTKEAKDGFVYIEKKKGKPGWIYMGDYQDNRYDVSPIAFFLAG